MDPLVGGHLRGGGDLVLIRRARLRLLGEGEDEDGSEEAAEEREAERDEVGGALLLGVLAEEADPMLLMPGLGGGEGEEDLAVLTGASGSEVTVDALFEALVREVALPPADGSAIG